MMGPVGVTEVSSANNPFARWHDRLGGPRVNEEGVS